MASLGRVGNMFSNISNSSSNLSIDNLYSRMVGDDASSASSSSGSSGMNLSPVPLVSSDENLKAFFIDDGTSNPVIKNNLLTKLKNGTSFFEPAPDSMPFERMNLHVQSNDYIVEIDDTDNGNLSTAFLNVLNKYRGETKKVYNTIEFYEDKDAKESEQLKHAYLSTDSKRSIFNPYFAVKSTGFSSNKPLLDVADPNSSNPFVDTSDCSIWKLLQLSATGDLGGAVYRLADFMYCKDLGKVANNHLITLRRYATPVGDNIFKLSNNGDKENMFSVAPDIGRLVTWFGTDENKLSDILKMSFKATWKEMNAEIQEETSQGAGSGILGMIANTLNPMYNQAQGAGVTDSNNFVSKFMGSAFGTGSVNFGGPGHYAGHKAFTNYDKHKIYEPKDTIQSNHYYEGKLEFNNEFTLNFSYKLRSYGDLNQKAVMLDLINNILRVTYTKGKFWGGSVHWVGPPGNNSLMKTAHAFIDEKWDQLAGFVDSFLNGSVNWQDIMASVSDMMSGAMDEAAALVKGGAGEAGKKLGDTLKSVVTDLKDKGIGEAIKGQLKNALGRPALYALNSFVSGADLGLWHVTIGNPRNPIAVIGNLIIDKTEMSFGDTPLGLDDFPTELKVSVSLKHCKPRDMVGIGHMFTKGETGLALPIGQTGWESFQPHDNDPGNPDKKPNYLSQTVDTVEALSRDCYGEYNNQQLFGIQLGEAISGNAAEIS